MKQQNVVAAKPLDKNVWNFIGNTIRLSNEVFASYDIFYNDVHYKKLWIFGKVIVLPLPFWLWTSNETQRSFEIYNNPSTGAASEYSLGKEKPKMLSSWPSWLCLVRRPYLLNYMSNSTGIFCVDRFEAGLGTGQISAQSDEKRLRSRVFHLTFTCFIRRSKGCTHRNPEKPSEHSRVVGQIKFK